ncbi:hypothetical protein BBU29805_0414 [Borreliella burgdorferi 29805]|nr:hypothetical protein BBU29805_0414 [Borreliella burgdorferi 29805]
MFIEFKFIIVCNNSKSIMNSFFMFFEFYIPLIKCLILGDCFLNRY